MQLKPADVLADLKQPEQRYSDNGDGTVTDTTTKLMWKRCSEGQTWNGDTCIGKAITMIWCDAIGGVRCAHIRPKKKRKSWDSFAGYSDWRVPSIKELRSLVYCSNGTPPQEAWKHCCFGKNNRNGNNFHRPVIDLQAFPNTPAAWFWTSSSIAHLNESAWVIDFQYGKNYNRWWAYDFLVRLVRTPQ